MKKLRIKILGKPQKGFSFWSNGNILEDSQRYNELTQHKKSKRDCFLSKYIFNHAVGNTLLLITAICVLLAYLSELFDLVSTTVTLLMLIYVFAYVVFEIRH